MHEFLIVSRDIHILIQPAITAAKGKMTSRVCHTSSPIANTPIISYAKATATTTAIKRENSLITKSKTSLSMIKLSTVKTAHANQPYSNAYINDMRYVSGLMMTGRVNRADTPPALH
jgi:hypothetical protein